MSEPQSPDAEVCPQCGCEADWDKSSWCAECGYYPAIGRLVETSDAGYEEQVYENWWEAVPNWLWFLTGGVIAIFIVSVAVRVVFSESPVRLWWTVLQLAGGTVAFFTAHLLAYLYGSSRSDSVGALDAVLKPVATWQPVLRTLPEKVKLLFVGSWGFAAAFTACFVIDGIDYNALFAPGPEVAEERKERPHPMAIIVETATTVSKVQNELQDPGSRSQSLEEAVEEFTGGKSAEEVVEEVHEGLATDPGDSERDRTASSLDGSDPADDSSAARGSSDSARTSGADQAAETPPTIECLVVGYTTSVSGEPRSLLLAAPFRRQLRFVARVPLDEVAPQAREQMPQRLVDLHQSWAVVPSPFGGQWLKPELFCEVQYSGWSRSGRLTDPYITRFAVVTRPVDARIGPEDSPAIGGTDHL